MHKTIISAVSDVLSFYNKEKFLIDPVKHVEFMDATAGDTVMLYSELDGCAAIGVVENSNIALVEVKITDPMRQRSYKWFEKYDLE